MPLAKRTHYPEMSYVDIGRGDPIASGSTSGAAETFEQMDELPVTFGASVERS